ncbi:methyltransferase domain-containing protein [Paraglaciecola aquimarina]|uniref:Malonyl-[acyl-carrier protein] O-methyltransferase n=1 Tax=Paraglaciecola aquimarina TaxID=1235557 RepID=A0ABU3SZK1_9ALTE|nr:methyltransferase domain-containing protein [Paraglaciecola aquimarina]MDU0355444.1 methyltransferase domain-containing protein [Paraglaciecola aquimarina]
MSLAKQYGTEKAIKTMPENMAETVPSCLIDNAPAHNVKETKGLKEQTITANGSDKSRIARQFSRAASTYDSAAMVQLDIATDAMAFLPERGNALLDIGCGTGRNSAELGKRCRQLLGLDLAFGMLSYAKGSSRNERQNVMWLQGDAESLPVQDKSVDRVYSSMVLQWCRQQNQVMGEVNRVMTSGGEAVLAIMCDGSFSELNHSWQQLDNGQHVNDFATVRSWQNAALAQGLQVHVCTKQYVTWHANLRQLLSSIKSIGANVVLPTEQAQSELTNRHTFNRQTLLQLEAVYRQSFAKDKLLPLTYQVCYLHCKKTKI